jgi:hypothetical protein
MPYILGAAQDRGISAVNGMSVAMITSAVFAGIAVWSGPETPRPRLPHMRNQIQESESGLAWDEESARGLRVDRHAAR